MKAKPKAKAASSKPAPQTLPANLPAPRAGQPPGVPYPGRRPPGEYGTPGAPPLRLSIKHRQAAAFIAAGYTQSETCRLLDMSLTNLHRVKKHPDWSLLVEGYLEKFVGSTLQSVLTRLAGETGPSIDTLVEVRDTAEEPGTRRLAAKDLLDGFLDRVMPRRGATGEKEDEKTFRLIIESEDIQAMKRVLDEANTPLIAARAPTPRTKNGKGQFEKVVKGKQVTPRTLDDFASEFPPEEGGRAESAAT